MNIRSFVIASLFFCLTVNAKIDISHFKDKITLDGQEISIEKAEIIIDKMPQIGDEKRKPYIIISLKTADGKAIKAKYSFETFLKPNCIHPFSAKITEINGDSCIVRNIPEIIVKGSLVVIVLKDSAGVEYQLKASVTVTEVH